MVCCLIPSFSRFVLFVCSISFVSIDVQASLKNEPKKKNNKDRIVTQTCFCWVWIRCLIFRNFKRNGIKNENESFTSLAMRQQKKTLKYSSKCTESSETENYVKNPVIWDILHTNYTKRFWCFSDYMPLYFYSYHLCTVLNDNDGTGNMLSIVASNWITHANSKPNSSICIQMYTFFHFV